jgi:hypothetical protein
MVPVVGEYIILLAVLGEIRAGGIGSQQPSRHLAHARANLPFQAVTWPRQAPGEEVCGRLLDADGYLLAQAGCSGNAALAQAALGSVQVLVGRVPGAAQTLLRWGMAAARAPASAAGESWADGWYE